ncbi:MAG: radical SAM protein [Candidatus Omnitrophica bacterium]|nr:radical SAM protein [Candidatus Omnitrophota bacterium]
MLKQGDDTVPFQVRTVMLYLTERCPLRCKYCYFRYKQGQDLPLAVAHTFIRSLQANGIRPGLLVFSGGEPVLCWAELRKLIPAIRKAFPLARLHMQTNGLLLDASKLLFIQQNRIGLEFGIDGTPETTTRWRRPMGRAGYVRLVRNINIAQKLGVPVGCTMTVHPQEVRNMPDNLRFLVGLGIKSIDITPAAFMPWTLADIKFFKKRYRQILNDKLLSKAIYVGSDHDRIQPGVMDLSVHPPGDVLTGDAFLCVSPSKRRQYSLWDQRTGHFKPEMIELYRRWYGKLWRRPSRPYRDYVSCSFHLVNRIMGRKYLNVEQIEPIMRFLTRSHLRRTHAAITD